MVRTPAQFALRARSFANELPKLERRTVEAAAAMVKSTAVSELRRAAGADLRLSGVGKRGARIGARYDRGKSTSTAIVRALGPVQLVESNTKPHRVPKKRTRGRRRVVVIPGVGVRASANHPGTRGKHPWARAMDRAIPKVPAVMSAETSKTLRGHFGG